MPALPSDITHLLFIDFEATCEEEIQLVPREIIEFPCVLVRVRDSDGNKDWTEMATFHEYVRPVRHPMLSSFCVKLTGITQTMVDAADPFPAVFERFEAWLRRHELKPESSLFVADSGWDVGTMLKSQLDLTDLTAPNDTVPFNKWLNLKTAYKRYKYGFKVRYPSTNLEDMLKGLDLSHEGRWHSGIDDARNITRIYKELDDRGCNTFSVSSASVLSQLFCCCARM